VRPPGLGSDAGFGAGVGVVGLLGGFALLAVGPFRRRWFAIVLALGAMLAVISGAGRLQAAGAVIALVAFALLSFKSGGRKASRPLAALLAVIVLAVPAGAVFVSIEGKSSLARYSDTNGQKTHGLLHIPSVIAAAPFGIGLGTVGAAAGFGGVTKSEAVEGHGASAETVFNVLTDELGFPGLVLFIALVIRLFMLVLPRLRRVRDFELRLYLTAFTATLVAFTLMGFEGPTMTSAAFGPFFWFATGTLAYWFAGPGWAKTRLQVAP
jgi:O-antigen ligase